MQGYVYVVQKKIQEEDMMQKVLLKYVLYAINNESHPLSISPNSISNSQ